MSVVANSKCMVAVVDYGIGNLRSAEKALLKVGANAVLTSDPKILQSASALVLPGVGAFGACMNALESRDLVSQLHTAVETGKRLLGICVGMQLLYEASSEAPGVSGIGLLPGSVEILPTKVVRPQMQWNRLHNKTEHKLTDSLDQEWMYFVHSYIAPMSAHVVATVEYGVEVPAVVSKDKIWATQFHPEKSSNAGLRLLKNFVDVVQNESRNADVGVV